MTGRRAVLASLLMKKKSADTPKEKEKEPAPTKLKPGELPKLDPNFKDPVLEKALEYLRSKAMARIS